MLRVGIVSRTHAVKVGHYRPVYIVQVSGAESQRAFLREVGAFGPRCESAALLAEALGTVQSNPKVDTFPEEALQRVRAVMSGGGVVSLDHSPARPAPSKHAAAPPGELLRTLPESDLLWDRVLSISADGEEDVFDLTVQALLVGWPTVLSLTTAVRSSRIAT